ncbi:hypothetical protein [Sporomusa sphaeroides]|uniref:Tyrosine recombinase XerC n=1 Tax=Sporomusa sphaeroides DSM 2875 TaxID=1337886 RepID=A0ABP2CAP8_9FIRM|nr:hypothetical protein [Sporomusa sphaeroides]OLS58771.1 tyrosine recombinase XerC [Sporomusa sphaeroides DSM 2875]CVK21372.1 Tyrosine recombinase XerC [Sporomusa sphaeroides DSM 2875]
MEARNNVSTGDLSLYISALNEKLEELNYSASAKNRMNSVWLVLMAYVTENAPTPYNEEFRQKFIRDIYGHCMGEKQSAFIVNRADLTVGDIRFVSPATVRIVGKGRKARIVPLLSGTEKLLQAYLKI